MISIGQLFGLMCVSVLWGITNPLMGKGSMGICDVKHGNILAQFLAELKFLLLNWKFILPLLMNQLGSVLFYIVLSSTELSITVPLTNGLTFVFTWLASQYFGEHPVTCETCIGLACILAGVTLCIVDKM